MEKKTTIMIAVIAVAVVAVAGIAIFFMNNQTQDKTINSVDDLNGANIGVQAGTTGDILATDEYEKTGKAKLFRYNTYSDAFMALKNKKVDALIMDETTAKAFIKTWGGNKTIDMGGEKEDYGFVFKKTNTELRDQFKTALAELKADGTFDQLVEFWLADHLDAQADPQITSTGTGKTIKVATSPDFPPYENTYKQQFTGFDMDLVRAICNKLDYKVEFLGMDFEGVISAVESGNADMAASGISITEERMQSVLFSDTYANSVQVIVARA